MGAPPNYQTIDGRISNTVSAQVLISIKVKHSILIKKRLPDNTDLRPPVCKERPGEKEI